MQYQTSFRPSQIDGFLFAESAGLLRGLVPVADFQRLHDALSSTTGELEYEVRGVPDEMGRPALRIHMAGQLHLTCQRCLGALSYPLRIDALLVLARSEAEVQAQPVDPDSPDRILGCKEMAVGALLEDELLLAVPFAPHHEDCPGAGVEGKGGSPDSPFANLRGLLNRGGRSRN